MSRLLSCRWRSCGWWQETQLRNLKIACGTRMVRAVIAWRRLRPDQARSSAPRVLLDGRKGAKIEASLEITRGIPDSECRARHGHHSLDLPLSGERLKPRGASSHRACARRNRAWRPALCHRERTVRVRSFSARLFVEAAFPDADEERAARRAAHGV